jgi:hypothetical protein
MELRGLSIPGCPRRFASRDGDSVRRQHAPVPTGIAMAALMSLTLAAMGV